MLFNLVSVSPPHGIAGFRPPTISGAIQALLQDVVPTQSRSLTSLGSMAHTKRQSPDDPDLTRALTAKRPRRESPELNVGIAQLYEPTSDPFKKKSDVSTGDPSLSLALTGEHPHESCDIPAKPPALQVPNLSEIPNEMLLEITQHLPGSQLLPLICSSTHFLETLAPSTLDSMGFSRHWVRLDHPQTFIDGFRLANLCRSFRPLVMTEVYVHISPEYQASRFRALAIYFEEMPADRALNALFIQACSSVILKANWQLLARAISAKGGCNNITFIGPGSFETTQDADLPPLSIPDLCFQNFDLSGLQARHFLCNNRTISLSLVHCAPYPILDILTVPSLVNVNLTSDYAPSRIIPFLSRHSRLDKITIKGSPSSLVYAPQYRPVFSPQANQWSTLAVSCSLAAIILRLAGQHGLKTLSLEPDLRDGTAYARLGIRKIAIDSYDQQVFECLMNCPSLKCLTLKFPAPEYRSSFSPLFEPRRPFTTIDNLEFRIEGHSQEEIAQGIRPWLRLFPRVDFVALKFMHEETGGEKESLAVKLRDETLYPTFWSRTVHVYISFGCAWDFDPIEICL
ncbi:hypothetical protein C8J56DRAFT_879871 [Mycena floridula]|nr:hypothetical protein C8J56DRAFT_879871 [Mycena floridula]